MSSHAQIIATIGPASGAEETLSAMIRAGMDIARINFAWCDTAEGRERVGTIRTVTRDEGRSIPIIADLPGPRVADASGHHYDHGATGVLQTRDAEVLNLCVELDVEYVALSFVGSKEDIELYRGAIRERGGTQKIIAKIERKVALENLDAIIVGADALMVARGDLGKEVPLEEIPFIQQDIIQKANAAQKPVITATQMLYSMTEQAEPTRAEVTDVEEAIRSGSDAVMLSEETSQGKYPVEAVAMMERIIKATERRYPERTPHRL